MRIAVITNSRIPSSTANSVQAMKVCDALVEVGHQLHVFAPAEAPPTDWDTLARQYGLRNPFPITWIPSRRAFRRLDFVWTAARSARSFGAELVYTWLPQSAAVEAWARRPVLLEMHADVSGPMGAWWLRQFWKSGRSRMLVTTNALRRALQRSTHMTFPDDAIRIEPNGVDLERYGELPSPAEARSLLQMPEAFTLGFTGHFYAGRGMELLSDLAGQLPEMQFLLVGGTPDAVSEWSDRLKSAGRLNVKLTGFVDNARLPLYQAAADVLLMPYTTTVSASSGQDIAEVINPMKMFEYMAARRPIVTSSLPAIREILNEDRAVFCPPDDITAWKKSISELAADPARRQRLAENARREVEKYTWLQRARRSLEGLDVA